MNEDRHILFAWIVDRRYALPAYLSIQSFLYSMGSDLDGICLTVFTAGLLPDTLLRLFRFLHPALSVNQCAVQDLEEGSATVVNRRLRFSIVESFSDHPVFLIDADTIFTPGIRSLVRLVKAAEKPGTTVWGVVEYEHTREASLYFLPIGDLGLRPGAGARATVYQSVFGADARLLEECQFNCGVVGFYQAAELAATWKNFYEKGLKHTGVNCEDDQVPLAVSMRKEGANIVRLLPAYNSMGVLNGDYAVFHAWGGKWLDELIHLLHSGNSRTDFGSHYQFLLRDTPEELIRDFIGLYDADGQGLQPHRRIDGNFCFESQYDRYANGAVLEIGSYSRGRGLAYLAQKVKAENSQGRVFALVLNENKEEVWQAIEYAGLSEMVEPVHTLHQIPERSLSFAFIESDLHYGTTCSWIEELYGKMGASSVIGGYDFTGHPGHEEERRKLKTFCERKKLSLRFEHKCFLIHIN